MYETCQQVIKISVTHTRGLALCTRNVDKLRQYVVTKRGRPASRINHVEHVCAAAATLHPKAVCKILLFDSYKTNPFSRYKILFV
jgi:hypothetical protein